MITISGEALRLLATASPMAVELAVGAAATSTLSAVLEMGVTNPAVDELIKRTEAASKS